MISGEALLFQEKGASFLRGLGVWDCYWAGALER